MGGATRCEAPHLGEHARQAEGNLFRKFISLVGHFEAISKVDVQNLNEQNDKKDAESERESIHHTRTFPVYL